MQELKFDRDLAGKIDHTVLAGATEEKVTQACTDAVLYGFAGVCVRLEWLPLVVNLLVGSGVMPICVVGFPDGTVPTADKVRETEAAIAAGAGEIDMVINLDLLRAGDFAGAQADIEAVVRAAQGRPVKVIIEFHLITPEEIECACLVAKGAGAAFVKTCTGFTGGGATVAAVALMCRTVGPNMGVKASGGVRDLRTALALVAAGAKRLGASASVAIVTGGAGAATY